ncbi:proteasome-type protease [Rubellimicrobium sp. CFH 75288]|uniref:proteasome-type protease n=1 Tax=Rubellimicrobium sp. CFH 75288 TaxID=2697034 RepID=UPI0014127AD6|nr:proteasome-type protease [Rubellimicrobium sp. CFH 75288]NAZ36142.1 peptidase [Rubellimicrobium sp. CFH 75288]
MTYCVGLKMARGLVFMADTRTNAGMDNISTFRKLFTWENPGETVITLMTAGNLATTQAVVSLIDERNKAPSERHPAILELPSMFQVARHVGQTLREVIAQAGDEGERAETYFNATLIVGGQVKGSEPRLFLIYPEGNFIEAGEDTPFLQIGEFKYGRPIIVRAFDANMSFEAAVKLLLVSFDSTVKANLSVGLPLDLHIYERDALRRGLQRRFRADDPYFQTISHGWGDALKSAFDSLPDVVL